MSSTECQRDGAAVGDGAMLCRRCGDWLAARLLQLAWYVDDLAAVVARQRGEGQHLVDYLTPSKTRPLDPGQTFDRPRAKRAHWTPSAHPILVDVQAAEVGREVWDLATWTAGKVATGLVTHTPTAKATKGLLQIAAERVDVLRQDEDALDLCDSVQSLLVAVMRLIDAPHDHQRARAYLGQCACGTTLHAAHSAIEAVCTRCGVTHDAAERKEVLRADAENAWLDLPQAREWVELVTGEVIPQGTLDSWLQRGRLGRNAYGQVVIATLMRLQRGRMETTRAKTA